MTTVYNLWYRHGDSIGGSHAMVLGTYSTREKAEEARAFLSDKPGFVDHGIEGFTIEPIKVDLTKVGGKAVGIEGTLRDEIAYDLWHRREDERGYDHDTLIGIYSSEARAEQGLSLVRGLPQFQDSPEAFEILKGPIDRTGMKEGFVTVYPGDEF